MDHTPFTPSDMPSPGEFLDVCVQLDVLLARSYEPTSMSEEYKRFHDLLQRFRPTHDAV